MIAPTFDWSFNAGQLVTVGVVTVSVVAFFVRDNERLRTFAHWMDKHEKEADTRDTNIIDLGKIAIELKTIVVSQDRRIEWLENDNSGRRRKFR